ncbi:uncharacterized protein [Physcomitrium patens]|uniref:uncharacterized protein isoform X6 n=1 Tax=Physcomitrium patens TaxID=3218 RepID=UPI003CCE3B10
MSLKELKSPWQTLGPPPQQLSRMQMVERKLLAKFRDEGAIQARTHKEWKANMYKYGIVDRAQLRDEVFELFHKQLEFSLREEGLAKATHEAHLKAWHTLLNAEQVVDISGIQHSLTRKMNNAYIEDKQTQVALAEFEAKHGLALQPSEGALAEQEETWESGFVMLGSDTHPPPLPPPPPLPAVDHIALRQESKRYLNGVKARLKKEAETKFQEIQERRAEFLLKNNKKETESTQHDKNQSFNYDFSNAFGVISKQQQEEENMVSQSELELSVRNDASIQRQLNEKRELEWILSVERDRMILTLMHQNYKDEVLHILDIWQKRKNEEDNEQNVQEKVARNSAISQIFEIGEKAGDYKVNIGIFVPRTEWKEWSLLYVMDALPILPPPHCINCANANDIMYAKMAADQYWREVEDWASPITFGPIGRNSFLGAHLHKIHLHSKDFKDHHFVSLIRFSLMLAIVGAPYSEDRNLRVSSPTTPSSQTSTNDSCTCVEAVRDLPLIDDSPPIPIPSPTPISNANPYHNYSWKGQLGMRAKYALDNNLPIPDEVIAHLMILVVSDLKGYEQQVENFEASNKLGFSKNTLRKARHSIKKPMKETMLPGFCFDGFPATPGQAAEFEKLLTGQDYMFWKQVEAEASKIAPPPQNVFPHRAISGLDGIFVLESVGLEDALDRAVGKIYDPLTGDDYHLELNPPPFETNIGLALRVKSLNQNHKDLDDRMRLASKEWDDMLNYLHQCQNTFYILNTKVNICPRHPAIQGAHCLVDIEEATNIATLILDAHLKFEDVVILTTTITKAEQLAQIEVKKVQKAIVEAQEVAKQYFNAMVTDIEAQKQLDKLLNTIPIAKEYLKKTSNEMIAPLFHEVQLQIEQIHAIVTKVEDVLEKAQEAFHIAKDKAKKTDIAIHHRKRVRDMMDQAKKSMQAINEANISAKKALELAHTLLKSTPTLDELKKEEKQIQPIPPPLLFEPLMELVNSENDIFVKDEDWRIEFDEKKHKISKPLFRVWSDIEDSYFDALPRAYLQIRHIRATQYSAMMKLKAEFLELLKRKNQCQEIFNKYQTKYNLQDFAFFKNKANQVPLQNQAASVAEELRTHCMQRNQEVKAHLDRSLSEFKASWRSAMANCFLQFVQAELDRHIGSCSLVHEYLTKAEHEEEEGPKPAFALQFLCSLASIMEPPLVSFPIPFWMTTLEHPYPELYKGLCQAFLVANRMLDAIVGRESLGPSIIGASSPPVPRASQKRPSFRNPTKGSAKGSVKGSTKSSTKGSVKGSSRGSAKDTAKNSTSGESVPRIVDTPADDLGFATPAVSMLWPIARMEVPMEPGVDPAIARDHQILYYRLELIARNCCIYFEEVYPMLATTYEHLAASIVEVSNRESKVMEDSIVYIKDSAIERIPLWFQCFFAEDSFIIAVPTLVKEPGPLKPITMVQWHVRLLLALGKKFKPAKSYVALDDAKMWVMEIIEEIHEIFKEDPAQGQQPRLPCNQNTPFGPFQRWVEKLEEVVESTMEDVDPPEQNFKLVIDWRLFLVALADAHFDYFLSKSSIDDIVQARTDFFVVVATKSLTDPTNEFFTLEDFLATWMWFDPDVDDEEEATVGSSGKPMFVESKERKEAPLKPSPSVASPLVESEWDFAAEMKKFIYGLLNKGKVGIPWHSLLLCCCRDLDKELSIRKAFNVLGAPMGPMNVTLSAEEMLCLCFPNGVQGAEESAVKPWDISSLKMMLKQVDMESISVPRSPGDSYGSESYLDDFSRKPCEQRTGMECVEPQKPPILLFCEIEDVMAEFLNQVAAPSPSCTPLSCISSEANHTIEVFVDALAEEQVEPLMWFTIDDVLQKDATAKLRVALFKIYGRSCAYPVPLNVGVKPPPPVRASHKK